MTSAEGLLLFSPCSRVELQGQATLPFLYADEDKHNSASWPHAKSGINMAGSHDVRSIIAGIASESESARKLSAYHLQSSISDPSFAYAFVKAQGVPALKQVVLEDNGNALAYALGSLTRLLEMDLGWDHLSSDVIERVRINSETYPLRDVNS